ncbi:MAG: hypothetical protein M0006_02995 [Magnetospirillum sp.]|nr:hypothetical protein [Magnetospirillum sp.]
MTNCADASTIFGFAPKTVKVLENGNKQETWSQLNPYDDGQTVEVTLEFDKSCAFLWVDNEYLSEPTAHP